MRLQTNEVKYANAEQMKHTMHIETNEAHCATAKKWSHYATAKSEAH